MTEALPIDVRPLLEAFNRYTSQPRAHFVRGEFYRLAKAAGALAKRLHTFELRKHHRSSLCHSENRVLFFWD